MTKSIKNAAAKSTKANTAAVAAAVVAAKGTPEVISTPAAATKADKAREIFQASYATSPVPQRKDILARVQAEAGLTKAGAATYLQNYKRKANLVVPRAAKVAPTA